MKATKTKTKNLSLVTIKMVKEKSIAYKDQITSPGAAAELFLPFFKGLDREAFYVLCLSHRKDPVCVSLVSLGSLTATIAEPREIFKAAILSNASSIVVAHNHPSGNARASAADMSITRRLKAVGKTMGIELDDHIIIYGETNRDYLSLRDEGLF